MSTPAFGDIQQQIQDKIALLRARVFDLKAKLPFTPPGILTQRTSTQGRILSGNFLKRPLLMRGSPCPGCNPQGYPRRPPSNPKLNPAIVDIGATRTSPSGAAVSEEIDPTRRFGLSIAT